MTQTPDQIRREAAIVKRFRQDWDLARNTQEFYRKPRGWRGKLRDFCWPRKHPVIAIYFYARAEFTTIGNMVLPYPIEAESIQSPEFPHRFRLQGGWTIPKADLRFLYKGPLVDETGKVLVPEYSRFESGKRGALVVGKIAAVLGPLGMAWGYRSELAEMARRAWSWLPG